MNVVDSSGWIEYFAGSENARFFEESIVNTAELIVPTICIYEVFKRLAATHGEDEALRAVGVMALGQEAPLEREIAIAAAGLSLEYNLPMADSILLATAQARQAVLWSENPHFKAIAGVRYIPKAAQD